MTKTKRSLLRLTGSAVCLALAVVLPIFTGSIPEIGGMLCPMHLPVLLCGFLYGPLSGGIVGAVAPLLRFALFGAPTLVPRGVCMAVELAVYGISAGALRSLQKRRKWLIYPALAVALLLGRLAGGISKFALLFMGEIASYGVSAFFTGYFIETVPGVIVQFLLIPPVVFACERAKIASD